MTEAGLGGGEARGGYLSFLSGRQSEQRLPAARVKCHSQCLRGLACREKWAENQSPVFGGSLCHALGCELDL